MKPILLIFLIVMLPCFCFMGCGCGDDDDDPSTSSGQADDDDDTSQADDDADDDANDDVNDDVDDDVENDPVEIIAEFLPVAQPGAEYSHQLKTINEDLPYDLWEIDYGQLPDGLTLDPATGLISGEAEADEGLYFFVTRIYDAVGDSDDEFFGIRVGDPETPGPMKIREEEFTDIYYARHTAHGMTYACETCDDPEGNWGFSQYGDSGMWSGTFCAGAAYRYNVTADAADLERVRDCAEGLDGLRRVTGQPGLCARGYAHKDDPFASGDFNSFYPDNPDSENHYGEGEWEDWYWRGDVSRDQITGVMLGWAVMYDLVDDDEIRQLAGENVASIADHVWDHGLKIVESGEMTKYGQLSGYWIDDTPMFNGFNAVICLAWFKLAYHITGESRFLEHYNELIYDKGYLWVTDLYCYAYMGYLTKWYNVHMAMDNFYILLRVARGDDKYDEMAGLLEKHLWLPAGSARHQRHARLEGNPWFSFQYADATGQRDPEALYKAMVFFSDYPLWVEKERHVDNYGRPEVEIDPFHPEWATQPLPPTWRHSSNFVWHRCPYAIQGGTASDRENSGSAYISPYWLGRYSGVIDPNW